MKMWNINSIIKMKTHTNYTRKNRLAKRLTASGMTLIEISLVIALLLGLIAVVFMGLGTYRQGADKAKCKMQLSAVQKAVRSGANMQNLAINAALPNGTAVFGAGLLVLYSWWDFPFQCPAILITWCALWPAAAQWAQVEESGARA